jgi:hypothetical protein
MQLFNLSLPAEGTGHIFLKEKMESRAHVAGVLPVEDAMAICHEQQTAAAGDYVGIYSCYK